jgi:hypothetical protein
LRERRGSLLLHCLALQPVTRYTRFFFFYHYYFFLLFCFSSPAQLSITLCVIYVIHRSRQLDNTQFPTNILTPGIRTHLIPLLLLSQFITVLSSNCSNPSYPNHFVQPQFCIPTVVDPETRYLSLILSVTRLKYLVHGRVPRRY